MTATRPETSNDAGRTISHDTIVIERHFDATPAQVFHAFADPVSKARWFAGDPSFTDERYELDFRVAGRETSSARLADGGSTFLYDARYEDIVPDVRIVIAYTMLMDERRISASLQTIELLPAGLQTRLILTEQMAILDGLDSAAARQHGLGELLDALDAELRRPDRVSRRLTNDPAQR
jgi:uncharacterized protein YndB with AHSA1/START domain